MLSCFIGFLEDLNTTISPKKSNYMFCMEITVFYKLMACIKTHTEYVFRVKIYEREILWKKKKHINNQNLFEKKNWNLFFIYISF